MSDALYERYKDALRRGHVATQRGRTDAALEAYAEATRIAPDRALPFIGIGTILARLEKYPEALTAFDAALERAPADETALRGRASVLIVLGRRAEAAAAFDRLAHALGEAGRVAAATDAASQALELAESRGRRSGLSALVGRLRGGPVDDAPAHDALERATNLLDATTAPTEAPEPEAAGATEAIETAPLVEEPPPPPPFDAVRVTADLEGAVESGDAVLALSTALDAAVGHRAVGHPDAAIDACYLALATNPADPDLHMALAEIYLDRGWRTAAADKLVLLARLTSLTDDTAAQERLCAIARARLPGEPRLASVCA